MQIKSLSLFLFFVQPPTHPIRYLLCGLIDTEICFLFTNKVICYVDARLFTLKIHLQTCFHVQWCFIWFTYFHLLCFSMNCCWALNDFFIGSDGSFQIPHIRQDVEYSCSFDLHQPKNYSGHKVSAS